jgi:hypothetical protein
MISAFGIEHGEISKVNFHGLTGVQGSYAQAGAKAGRLHLAGKPKLAARATAVQNSAGKRAARFTRKLP